MTFGFISDKPASEREQFLLELVNQLEELGAERFGVFAILPNGDTFQGYYRMEFGDKLLMSGHVQMDAVEVEKAMAWLEGYTMTDTEQIYSNGTAFVPLFRVKQAFVDKAYNGLQEG